MKGNRDGQSAGEGATGVRKAAGPLFVLLGAVLIAVAVRQYRVVKLSVKETATPVLRPGRHIERADITQIVEESPGPEIAPQTQVVDEGPVVREVVVTEPAGEEVAQAADDGRRQSEEEAALAAERVAAMEQQRQQAIATFKTARGRQALAGVGHDPQADEVWIEVINDPGVSANARSNLIEDLNEDGISNPSNPSMRDLPVIVYRIQLIEDLAPSAMDKVNADAFAEAHKDLVNMANRLTGPR